MTNPYTEGDARLGHHAEACGARRCTMACRCWCHGIRVHLDGTVREDAEAAEAIQRKMDAMVRQHREGGRL